MKPFLRVRPKTKHGHEGSDTVFDPSTASKMALAVFDHAGDHFHAVSEVVSIDFQ